MTRTERATVSRIAAALVTFVLAAATIASPALAAGRGWAPRAKAQAAAAAKGDDEQRGVVIPDIPPRPPGDGDRDSDDDRDGGGDHGGGGDSTPSPTGGSTGAGPAARSVAAHESARPALPETGGEYPLLLVWFGSLLVGAGFALRYAVD